MVAALISKHRDARASKGRRVAAPYEVRVNKFCADFAANPSVLASPIQLPCRGAYGGVNLCVLCRLFCEMFAINIIAIYVINSIYFVQLVNFEDK